MPQMTSFLGLAGMFLIAWIFSENRRAAQWRLALMGTSLQFVLALLVLKTEAGRFFFSIVKSGFGVLTDASSAGAEFVFGNLAHALVVMPGFATVASLESKREYLNIRSIME